MTHRNDSKSTKVGGTNINDGELVWLQVGGATSPNKTDARGEYLAVQGQTGHVNDSWFAHFTFLGLLGALADKFKQFWETP
jgi:hypothetical protein